MPPPPKKKKGNRQADTIKVRNNEHYEVSDTKQQKEGHLC